MIPGYDPFLQSHGCWFDPDAAQEPIDFFHKILTHVEGALAGQPFILERWQQAVLANLFGWKRRDIYGRTVRRFKRMLFYVPRKNGKTPFVAGICLFVLFCDGEQGAQVYSAAADREQAGLLYRHAVGMVDNEPELEIRSKVYRGYGQLAIEYPDTSSAYKVLSSTADTKHGFNPHFVAVDELHAQPNRDLVDVFETAMSSVNRAQPLLVYLTTADFDRDESVCNEVHEHAKRVRDNRGNPSEIGYAPEFLPVIYEAEKDDDWKDPATWEKTNPNIDVSVSREYLETACRKAQEDPQFENTFKRLHLNMRTEQAVRWMPMDVWRECEDDFDEDLLIGRECCGGLDLASIEDTVAFAMVFPPTDDDPLYRVLCRFWIPEAAALRDERKRNIPYSVWAREGHITLIEGARMEYEPIQEQIMADAEKFGLTVVNADRWGLEYMRQDIDPSGERIVEFGQGYKSFSMPMKLLKGLVRDDEFAHDGNPVLSWQMGNVVAVTDDADNVKPSKKKCASKIDGPVAVIMALGATMVGEEMESVRDFYSTNELEMM